MTTLLTISIVCCGWCVNVKNLKGVDIFAGVVNLLTHVLIWCHLLSQINLHRDGRWEEQENNNHGLQNGTMRKTYAKLSQRIITTLFGYLLWFHTVLTPGKVLWNCFALIRKYPAIELPSKRQKNQGNNKNNWNLIAVTHNLSQLFAEFLLTTIIGVDVEFFT